MITRSIKLVCFVGAIFSVLILWAIIPALPKPVRAVAQAERWGLPGMVVDDAARITMASATLSVLQEHNIWGGANLAASDATPLTSPDWRVMGIVSRGEERSLLIAITGKSLPLELQKGDKLPGGSEILQINQDNVRIRINGRVRKFNFFEE